MIAPFSSQLRALPWRWYSGFMPTRWRPPAEAIIAVEEIDWLVGPRSPSRSAATSPGHCAHLLQPRSPTARPPTSSPTTPASWRRPGQPRHCRPDQQRPIRRAFPAARATQASPRAADADLEETPRSRPAASISASIFRQRQHEEHPPTPTGGMAPSAPSWIAACPPAGAPRRIDRVFLPARRDARRLRPPRRGPAALLRDKRRSARREFQRRAQIGASPCKRRVHPLARPAIRRPDHACRTAR